MMRSGSNLHNLRQAAQMSQWKTTRRKLPKTNKSRQPCLELLPHSTVTTRTTTTYRGITEKFQTRNLTLNMTTKTNLDSSLDYPIKT